MKKNFDRCFPPYDEDAEDLSSFGVKHSYMYSTERETHAVSTYGKFATYGAGGFMVTVPTHNKTEAYKAVDDMYESRYVDWQTRAVIVDFTLYNSPLNKLCAVQMLYEFPPQGGISRSVKNLFANVYRFETTTDILGEMQQFFIAIYIIWFLKDEANIFKRLGMKHFYNTIGDFWTVAEWVNVFMIIVQIALRMEAVITVYASQIRLDTTGFVSFYSFAAMDEKAGTLEAFSLFLIIMRTLQFTVIHPRLAYHIYAYYKSSTDYMAFFCLYLVILFPFISVGRISFGNTLERYNDVWTSFVTLVTASIGNFQVHLILHTLIVIITLMPNYLYR